MKTMVHYSLGKYNNSFYITSCGLDDATLYITKNNNLVTCTKCLEKNEENRKRRD